MLKEGCEDQDLTLAQTSSMPQKDECACKKTSEAILMLNYSSLCSKGSYNITATQDGSTCPLNVVFEIWHLQEVSHLTISRDIEPWVTTVLLLHPCSSLPTAYLSSESDHQFIHWTRSLVYFQPNNQAYLNYSAPSRASSCGPMRDGPKSEREW